MGSDGRTTVKQRILITGARGFLGQALLSVLNQEHVDVVAFDRAPLLARQAAAGPSQVTHLEGDLLRPSSLDELEERGPFDTIVHLAAILPADTDTGAVFAVNVGGTAVTQKLCRPDTHFILLSSGLVYGDQPGPFHEGLACQPLNPYAQSKLAAETVVSAGARATGGLVTVLRASVIYGPAAPSRMLLVSLVESLRLGEVFPMSKGEQYRDFLHVDDAAVAIMEVMRRHLGGIFNLCSGEATTVLNAAELAASVAGRQDLLRPGALPYRDGEVFDYRLDCSALSTALGWSARIKLREGLESLWKSQKEGP